MLECSSGIRYLPAAHGRQVNGARKLRFERMTPIRKAREKTEVAATGHSPGDDGLEIAKKRSLGPQNFS